MGKTQLENDGYWSSVTTTTPAQCPQIHSDTTLEFACVIKTICDEYNVDPSDLQLFPPVDQVLANSIHIKFKKRLVIKIPIPSVLAPNSLTDDPHLKLSRLRSIITDYPRSLTSDNGPIGKLGKGLGEFELKLKNKTIQFWVWNGAQDYYIFGGCSAYFVRRKDVLALTFYIKRAHQLTKSPADIPILPSKMLEEIYKNSVGFLLKGRDMQDQYKKYRIPYKRGVLLSGKTGCVTGATKIRIRKKSDKGTHKIHEISLLSNTPKRSKVHCMQIGEITEIRIDDFFELVEQGDGIYEVETPQGWVEIGDLKREKKECFLLRTANGTSLESGHDHLIETQKGWEKVEDIDIQQTVVKTQHGDDQVVAREYIGVRDTFDFEVLSEEHKYYANGIVSHNCGKTMSCRWLRELCEQNDLGYRVINMEDYLEAVQHGRVRALKDRKKGGGGNELSTFLSELDGLDPAKGVVYVFTTNYINELDEAFVRPGRIDLWLPFQLPSQQLRKKFIDQRFNEEIKEHIDTANILERTKDYSFAELEEIRKLICMDLIDGKEVDIDRTFKIFDKHRKDFETRGITGFGSLEKNDEDSYMDIGMDDDYGPMMPHPFYPGRRESL